MFCTLPLMHIQVHAESQTPPPKDHDMISGELELGLYTAGSDRDSEFELDQVLRLRVDPPNHERLHLRTTIWTIEDLGGEESPTSIFRSLNDTSGAFINTRVLNLYLDVEGKNQDRKSLLRLGRQRITESVAYIRIDGGYYRARKNAWTYYAFLGARASLYESSHDSLTTGAGLSWRPKPGTLASLDHVYGEDVRRNVSSGDDDIQASLTSFSIRHALNQNHNLYGKATFYDNDLDEFNISTQGFLREHTLLYTLSYRRRVSILSERPTDFPQFYHVVGEINGYDDFQAILNIPLSERFEIGLEAQIHDADDSQVSTGNRDYTRYGLALNINNIKGHYDARLILEFWNAEFGESEKTLSGEVSRRWAKTRVALGVDYDRFQDRLYSYDPATQDPFVIHSTEDIYALYMRVRHEFNDQNSLGIRASIEDDDSSDAPYWRLRTQYTFRF